MIYNKDKFDNEIIIKAGTRSNYPISLPAPFVRAMGWDRKDRLKVYALPQMKGILLINQNEKIYPKPQNIFQDLLAKEIYKNDPQRRKEYIQKYATTPLEYIGLTELFFSSILNEEIRGMSELGAKQFILKKYGLKVKTFQRDKNSKKLISYIFENPKEEAQKILQEDAKKSDEEYLLEQIHQSERRIQYETELKSGYEKVLENIKRQKDKQ